MSDFEVKIERIEIFEHPSADALELAQIGLFRAVVPKGQYKTGDYAVYIPSESVLPPELIEELGLIGKLAGSKHDRVKPIKLRKELSEGIVCRPSLMWEEWLLLDNGNEINLEKDYAELLGITKCKPVIPPKFSGKWIGSDNLIPWIEIENIKKYPDWFVKGEQVEITTKIHGSCICVSVDSDGILVSSKGLAKRHIAIEESDDNIYWRALKEYKENQTYPDSLLFKFQKMFNEFSEMCGTKRIGIFGEVYGNVQDLNYGVDLAFAAFDVYIIDGYGTGEWVSANYRRQVLDLYDIPQVPLVWMGQYSLDKVLELTKGKENVSGKQLHVNEGVVVRAIPESKTKQGDRRILKSINEDYLLRKGKVTEYQ